MLQIQEPGSQEADAATKTYGFGIDLGTTHSIIAIRCNDHVEVLTDDNNEKIIPSIVHYGEKECVVGQEAAKMRESDPTNTIVSFKRLIGRDYDEISRSKFFKLYDLAKTESNLPVIITRQGKKSPVEIAADILRHLHGFAKKRFATSIEDTSNKLGGVVITVPAYFDDAQRQAVKDAAKLANISLYRLLNEPTAAALAYALDKKAKGAVAVYDLGGGTFDISILRLERGVFRVLSTGGNTALGGDDFDGELANHIAQQLGQDELGKEQQNKLFILAKQAKEELSDRKEVELDTEFGNCVINRSEFEKLILSRVEESLAIMKSTLKASDLDVSDIADIVLVGGSTRIPLIRQKLAEFFGKEPLCSINPDLVVAMGASIQADVLAGNKRDSMLLLDVIPLSLGLETMGGLNEKLIRRNSSIPVEATHDFTTYKDGQTAMSFHIVQGERELVDGCRSLARFTLRGIPPQMAGQARVRVHFRVDADGLLNVTAQDLSSGELAEVDVHPTYGMSEKDFASILKRSFAAKEEDNNKLRLQIKQQEGKELLDAVDKALRDEDIPPTVEELSKIMPSRDKLKKILDQSNKDNVAEMEATITELGNQAEPFISRRMSEAFKLSIKS